MSRVKGWAIITAIGAFLLLGALLTHHSAAGPSWSPPGVYAVQPQPAASGKAAAHHFPHMRGYWLRRMTGGRRWGGYITITGRNGQ